MTYLKPEKVPLENGNFDQSLSYHQLSPETVENAKISF
jgi:hypothetical protein